LSDRIFVVLTLFFAGIPIVGELFLLVSTGQFNPTIFAAIGIATLLCGNLVALKFHKRAFLAHSIFFVVFAVGVTVAIAADGGIESPLWFFQLLVILGAGIVFGKFGTLVAGIFTVLVAIAHFMSSNISSDMRMLTEFTSVVASSVIFTVIGYLYERDKTLISSQSAKLVSVNDELRQFSYRTSHDLKSPLITVKNLSELVSEDIRAGEFEEALQNTDRIAKCASTLECLVVDILDLAKADLSDQPVQLIDLSQIVQQITERLLVPDDRKQISIQTNINHTGKLILPKARITQVLENLISNAVRYSDPSETRPYLKIASSDRDDFVEVTVQDNGLGISEEFADRLFTMFERFHPEVASGSGLGLYIVKKHIDKLGATIKYQSTPDGSLFTLTLNRTMAS
jgi:signal transduction histidine kinase